MSTELESQLSVKRAPAAGPPRTALLGWSLQTMVALQEMGLAFVVVAPAEFESFAAEHGVPFIGWDYGRFNERSAELVESLQAMGVEVAVPLYEETVEWAGALNAQFRDDPRLFSRYMLFRDKGMMKRKALMSGIRVGVFEEVDSRERVRGFFRRVNEALLKLEGEAQDPVHIKPLNAAGSVGHRVLRSEEDIDALEDGNFPCLIESHLVGQEFSCEVFVHSGQVRFLNITEYVHLGYSNFVPAGPALQERRGQILEAIEQLIDAFGIEYGMIHPEYFLSPDGTLHFGEVAARIPGGHIFDLIKRAYGFDPYAAFVLCCDPETTEDELAAIFPAPEAFEAYAGCLMVYPKGSVIRELQIPDELASDPYLDKHDLFPPMQSKVPEREGFGNHFGTVYLFGPDADRMTQQLLRYEGHDFYA